MIQNNGKDSLLYTYTDNQGSLLALTDENGNVVQRYAYDPWGVRRNPDDWTQDDNRTKWITNRGYTGHEHLDAFGIINMNGRVYDPLTAMFFSPDPFIKSPGDWMNYNRYGYVMNNPMLYTDPSGYRYKTAQELETVAFWMSYTDGLENRGYYSFKYGGYGGGGISNSPIALFNTYIEVLKRGYEGNFNDFTQTYDGQFKNDNFNGTITINFTTQKKSTLSQKIVRIGDLEHIISDLIVYPVINHSFTFDLNGGGMYGGNSSGQGALKNLANVTLIKNIVTNPVTDVILNFIASKLGPGVIKTNNVISFYLGMGIPIWEFTNSEKSNQDYCILGLKEIEFGLIVSGGGIPLAIYLYGGEKLAEYVAKQIILLNSNLESFFNPQNILQNMGIPTP